MDSGRYKSVDVSARVHTDPKRVVRGPPPPCFPQPVPEYTFRRPSYKRPSYTHALRSPFHLARNRPTQRAARLQRVQNIRPSIADNNTTFGEEALYTAVSRHCMCSQ